jgi:WhiB family redox-sensing transcriptional regulator
MTATTALTRRATTPAAQPDRQWVRAAACQDEDPDLFFSTGAAQTEMAKAVCATCPVRLQCLRWALESGQNSGVWGGLSEDERRLLKQPGRARARGANRNLLPVRIVRQQLDRYLDLAADGLTVEDIAVEMGVSPATIRNVASLLRAETSTKTTSRTVSTLGAAA